jgi:hypothetical protein
MSALIALIAFIAVASPMAFKSTRGILGNWIASPEGLATFKGLFLHGIVFLLIVCLLVGRQSGYLEADGMTFETRDDQDDQNNKHFQENRFMT